MRELIRLVLAGPDLEFIEVDNATDGINTAINVEPDIILADEHLGGKSATAICDLLKREYGLDYIPFVVLTGQIHAYDHSRGMLAGVDEIVTKPFEAEDLVQKIRDLLEIYRDRRPKELPAGGERGFPEAPARDLAGEGEGGPREEAVEDAGVIEGITRDIYSHLRESDEAVEQYEDPISSFLDDSAGKTVSDAPAPAARGIGGLPIPGASADFKDVKRPSPGPASEPDTVIRVGSTEVGDLGSRRPAPADPKSIMDLTPITAPRTAAPFGTAANHRPEETALPSAMEIAGLNLADEDLERLVAMEIKRRLSKIRLQDLENEIKRIFSEAVNDTVQRLLPQIKTEITLTVVKMLKNK